MPRHLGGGVRVSHFEAWDGLREWLDNRRESVDGADVLDKMDELEAEIYASLQARGGVRD